MTLRPTLFVSRAGWVTGTEHGKSAHETHTLGVGGASLEVEEVRGPTQLRSLVKVSSPRSPSLGTRVPVSPCSSCSPWWQVTETPLTGKKGNPGAGEVTLGRCQALSASPGSVHVGQCGCLSTAAPGLCPVLSQPWYLSVPASQPAVHPASRTGRPLPILGVRPVPVAGRVTGC